MKKCRVKTKHELVKIAEEEYWKYDPKKLNRVWLTHQQSMNAILEHNGGNDYKLPHMKKAIMKHNCILPKVLPITMNDETTYPIQQ